MLEREVTLTNEVGLHARPAAVFSKAAGRFSADITIVKNDAEANAKSMLSVLKLDVRKGDRITVVASGEDEGRAIDELVTLIESL
ncbi:MAG: HPr family phosphocarrier protein [Actinobacteria bacterium]|nr:HPr family phosphocarrier protein [Actinomycetota bacterium]